MLTHSHSDGEFPIYSQGKKHVLCYCCGGMIKCALGMVKLIGTCECKGRSVLAEPFHVRVGIVGRSVLGSSFLCASVIGVIGGKYSVEPSRGLMLSAGGLIGGSGIFLFLLAQQPPVGQDLLIHEVSRSHTTTHHSQWDCSGRVISSSQRPEPDNTQYSHQTYIHAPGGIRNHNLSRRAATDLRLRPRGRWYRRRGYWFI